MMRLNLSRHCEARAARCGNPETMLDCFASLAMTAKGPR
jgi:hypothetical protein